MELADDSAMLNLALDQFREAPNMTDTLAALSTLAQREGPQVDQCLDAFYAQWQADPLVIDKWFAVQATSRRADTLARVRALSMHPAFSLKNPNKVYALLRSFAQGNPARFHGMDGAGYRFMSEQLIALDDLNPQVAARLAGVFNDWRRYAEPYRSAQREALLALRDKPTLSKDMGEIVGKALLE